MIELGFWSKLVYKTSGFDSSQLVYNSSRSEFTEESVQRAFADNDIHSQIKQELDVNSHRKHVLAFVPSIDGVIQFAQEYPNSASIYSGMHESERERVISEFRRAIYASYSTYVFSQQALTIPRSIVLFSVSQRLLSLCIIRY